MKFRKKPVVIEAFCWTSGPDQEEDPVWVVEAIRSGRVRLEHSGDSVHLVIYTLEDGPDRKTKHVANIGDWIIKGIKGELYPCKPDIFEATYEKVED